MQQEFYSRFLKETDHTGRFIVVSKRTGVKYFVEPIGNGISVWGDLDPATKQLTGSYGEKYRGSIEEKESLITPENGFSNIKLLDKGVSPLAYIDWKDAQYPDKK